MVIFPTDTVASRELEGLLENVPYNSIKFYENNTNGRSNIYFYQWQTSSKEYYTVLYALEGKACRIINKKPGMRK